MFVQLYMQLKKFYEKYFAPKTSITPVGELSGSNEKCYAYAYDVYY